VTAPGTTPPGPFDARLARGAPPDPFDARLARRAPAPLRAFNDAGVLAAADVHVALRLAALAGEPDPGVLLGAALAVRGPRLGHVYTDLATVRETTVVDVEEPIDLAALPWPDPGAWTRAIAASPLAAGDGPLRLEGTRLYLDRYWREEREIAAGLRELAGERDADPAVLADGLARLFGPGDERQRLAAATAVLRRLAVVAGGPGTGKTTTVARIVALLAEQARAAGAPPPMVALAAPTGKAADRLGEAVQAEGRKLDVDDATRALLLDLEAVTLHRLLGWRPGSHSRFRHHRGNRLAHDVVVVDETSMVSLTMMARLVEAVRPTARLVLVGDPAQLASIEAGAVLGDVVGPAANGLRLSSAARARLEAAGAGRPEAAEPPPGATIADGVVVLDREYRFGEGIAQLAAAVRGGDATGALRVLADAPQGVTWIEADAAEPASQLAPVREAAVAAGRAVFEAARAGDGAGALDALGSFRLLCAHRRGPHGVAAWQPLVEAWLAAALPGFRPADRWYVGRPLLVLENDYGLRLFNGDTGVVVAGEDGAPAAAFSRGGEVATLSPARLDAVDTVYAMTIHKSQGSQFGTAAVLLPDPGSRLLTRELLYTAITRAQRHLVLVGTEAAITAAIERPIARASGLRELLWGYPGPE
jgi:exodeoxyribonuclease V alpha subunit